MIETTTLKENLSKVLKAHPRVLTNISRKAMIEDSVSNGEAIVSESGALATWTPPESTGRSPKDTVVVKRAGSEANLDWSSPNNIPITEETFDMLYADALDLLRDKPGIYETDRVIGADSAYALPVKVVTDKALHSLFIDNMFRPVPADIHKSVFYNDGYTLLVLPYDKLKSSKYEGRLRKMPDGSTSNMAVAMDMDRKTGVIIGSAYCGSMKKMLFTVMNYLLPFEGVLPIHCSANEGKDGKSALLLGLSGTGKTTLSADPNRALLGDDEHGWGDNGIANFENGCYAKMIDIDPSREPDIYDAVMRKVDYTEHGSIVENAMVYPDGKFDFCDDRFTPNSRASYLLSYLKNIKESSVSGHPTTILFLTADAYGVLPPVSKLNPDQAMLWFLMGYTSKLAGTETGITEPVATFSRFFGKPFMPLNPHVYADMLGKKMEEHNTKVYLINTGWSGGAYGVGKRMDIKLTRKMVDAALNGDLEKVEFTYDDTFHLNIPVSCPGVPSEILIPKNTWDDKAAYDEQAKMLAQKFSDAFDKNYGTKSIAENIVKMCPGK
jgi:phosphoenolpyruvate carboxykinase (ATP)